MTDYALIAMCNYRVHHIAHYCEHPGCTVFGGFGFSRPPKAPPRWYCYDHRPAELLTPHR